MAASYEDDPGQRLVEWRDWLEATFAEHDVKMIVHEQLIVVPGKQFDFNHVIPNAQKHGIMWEVASRHHIRVPKPLSPAKWRARFIGQARAPASITRSEARTSWLKDQAIKACVDRCWYVTEHDEADALGMLDFAMAAVDQDYRHRTDPLARRADLKASVAAFRGEQ